MSNHDKFEAMLIENMPVIPPEDIVSEVTPWRQAMDRVIVGIAMTTITLNFLYLNYILPAIGIVAMLLGFRALRKENKWFKTCYVITLIRAVYLFSNLIWNTTIFQYNINSSSASSILTIINLVLVFSMLYCFWQAIKEVKIKAELEVHAESAVALIVWYIIIGICGYVRVEGMVIVGGLFIAYFFIIRSLSQLSKELDEAGYVIQTTDVRFSDSLIIKGIVSILLVGEMCGYLLFNSYPMEWKIKDEAEHIELVRIKEHLLELGFPENVLNDMSAEDILACEDAQQIVVDVNEYPLNDGREVEETYLDERWITTVYDVKELKITGVAIQLADEGEWVILHHFLWQEEPEYLGVSGFYGTESIQLWPVYKNHSEGWRKASDVTGRVLYDIDGTTYHSEYYYLGEKEYTSNSMFFGTQTSKDIFTAFSFQNEGEQQRGYLQYSIKQMEEGWITDSWMNYTHQQSLFQYPVMTAMEKRISNSWNDRGTFKTIQDAFQFYITEDGIEMAGE